MTLMEKRNHFHNMLAPSFGSRSSAGATVAEAKAQDLELIRRLKFKGTHSTVEAALTVSVTSIVKARHFVGRTL
jgi:antitoxin component HigA of HigAB toxin-antitoxin module